MRSLLLSSALLFVSQASAAPYTVVDLGTLGGATSQAHGINAQGWVVGESQTAAGATHAFRWRDGSMTDLGLNGSIAIGRAVNDLGQIGGYYYSSSYEAFRWSGTSEQDLGDLGARYAAAYAINGSGHVAGSSYTKDFREHAFLFGGHTMTDLGTLGGEYSTARGLNDGDQAAGFAYLANGSFHAFVTENGQMRDLGTLGGDNSAAHAINNAGQVVGQAYLTGNASAHAFLWGGSGSLVDLGALPGGTYSEAHALDSNGQRIVGAATVPSTNDYLAYHAFLWQAGTMRDLNDDIPAGSGWVLEDAAGVNDAGQIVGTGTRNGARRAFLLRPTSPIGIPMPEIPRTLTLSPVAPNPTRDATVLSYGLPRDGQVSLVVLDASGRSVRTLASGPLPAGPHTARWDLKSDAGRTVGSGVYFIQLALDDETRTVRTIVER